MNKPVTRYELEVMSEDVFALADAVLPAIVRALANNKGSPWQLDVVMVGLRVAMERAGVSPTNEAAAFGTHLIQGYEAKSGRKYTLR